MMGDIQMTPEELNHPDPIIRALNQIMQREFDEQDDCRAEIKERGTYWAGREIWELRRAVAYWKKETLAGRAKRKR
jgi:hypothetical protein